MASVDATPTHWRTRLTQVVGPLGSVRTLGASAYLVQASGRALVAKVGQGAGDEAEGLRRLDAVRGAPPVPEIVLAQDDLLVTAAVEHALPSAAHEESLGLSLARLHREPWPHWGGGSSWIGACRVDPSPWPDAASFYGARLTALAARCGLAAAVARVTARLGELLPAGGPSLVHGDLWWGNVLFGTDGRAWLIDPSVHGGHPEEDLAMLALFGPVPARLRAAYDEVSPPSPGWEARVPLFQLLPLLVHAVLFGEGYRAEAEAVARRFA